MYVLTIIPIKDRLEISSTVDLLREHLEVLTCISRSGRIKMG